jgi:hypothetical protein
MDLRTGMKGQGVRLMNETRIANIELFSEIEELESKFAPSGAATLGDL